MTKIEATKKRLGLAARAAKLRQQGLSNREIADELGISTSYASNLVLDPDGSKAKARKDTYRRPCPECGKLMGGGEGRGGKKAPKLCFSCATKKAKESRRWTREAIIEAIQLFAERNGRPPTASEWLIRKELRGADYPPTSAIFTYKGKPQPFSSWAEAIESAGFARPKRGHKLMQYGQGSSTQMRDYVVLTKEEDGKWSLSETKAHNPELAIGNVAFRPGEYFALPKKLFVVHEVAPKTVYAVMPSTPGGKEEE